MYKLLIADDEFIEREAVKYIVNSRFEGAFEICEAANGREAIEKAGSFNPDIIFFDIKMPGINGLEAAAKIREMIPECRIVLISAHNYFNYARDALALGADDYITKPAPPDVIAATLEKVVKEIDLQAKRKKKEEENDIKLKNVVQYLEEELVNIITAGEVEEKTVNEFLDMLGVRCSRFIWASVALTGNELEEEEGEVRKRIAKKRLAEALKKKLSENGRSFFMSSAGQKVNILLTVDEEQDDYRTRVNEVSMFSKVHDGILSEMLIDTRIGISNSCELPSQLHSLFMQAKTALGYGSESNPVVCYGDIVKESTSSSYPAGKEKQIYDYFMLGDEKKTLELLDEIVDWIVLNMPGIISLRQNIYGLLMVLMREASISLNLMELNSGIDNVFKSISSCDNPAEIRSFANSYIREKLLKVNGMRKSRNSGMVSRVIEYLEKNYSSDIMLEDAAEYVKISPFYLSRIFRKETGKSLVDHLTDIRVKKAKELLADPVNNIKDVCYMVGYNDPNYFTRLFKKECGITPKEFRNSIV